MILPPTVTVLWPMYWMGLMVFEPWSNNVYESSAVSPIHCILCRVNVTYLNYKTISYYLSYSFSVSSAQIRTCHFPTFVGRQMSFHPFSSRRTWLYDISRSVFTELDSETGSLSEKRISSACAAIIITDSGKIAALDVENVLRLPFKINHLLPLLWSLQLDENVWILLTRKVCVLHICLFNNKSIVSFGHLSWHIPKMMDGLDSNCRKLEGVLRSPR